MSIAPVQIRLAVHSDADKLVALDDIAANNRERKNFIFQAISARDCYVAVADQQVIGYAVLQYSFYHMGFIPLVMVQADRRRHGIGCALVQFLETKCKTPKLFTSTNESNEPMQGLLKKLAFEPSGRIENLDDGGAELVFLKRLH